jgi:asparagine synthetase B (glutamine-hydrolysing)
MCGIYCSISLGGHNRCNKETRELLEARGPDSVQELSISIDVPDSRTADSQPVQIHIYVLATVLALRGDHVEAQPLKDKQSQSFLCWNGEAWKQDDHVVAGSDSQHVFALLLRACHSTLVSSKQNVLDALTSIAGPFAFVFYHAASRRLFFGRDQLGRRSLLSRNISGGGLAFCSITDAPSSSWTEVETSAVHFLDLSNHLTTPETVPCLTSHPRINDSLPNGLLPTTSISSETVLELEERLLKALSLRIADIPALGHAANMRTLESANIAVLFSGGLDCTVLARLAHDILPLSEPIDLLNVAFENPRSMAAASKLSLPVCAYESCPDRKTGRSSHLELLRVCGGREWRFVAIDVPFEESERHHSIIVKLMAPHKTEMDLSIAKAFYFAARGQGQVIDPKTSENRPHWTRARVLLSGLGADELFGGYTRHAVASARRGYRGLIEELEIDLQRLGHRNLGRDDRVISHWAKEVRYPYLDEDFMRWALQLPVWEKCGFRPNGEAGLNDKDDTSVNLEPSKQALRLLAWRLGMKQAATERKRAIQFGARTAKMQPGTGQKRGTDIIDLID